MAIIVDEAIWKFKGSMYCHMMSDVAGKPGLDELHTFAARLGMRRSWFQDKPRHPHYDLSANKRDVAIRLGAEPVTPFELIERTKGKF